MTWQAKVVAKAHAPKPGEEHFGACHECALRAGCRVAGAAWPLASLLTSVDTHQNGTCIGGTMLLECNHFQPKDAQASA